MNIKIFISCFVVLMNLTSCKQNNGSENMDFTTVKELDINRYLGTWYEIARYDNSFERGLVGVTANYSLRNDGKIRVINRGYKNSLEGKLSQAKGKAKIPDKDYPGKLKVSFFLFFYADYFVLELDPNYRWALVSSSSDKYLWILSRTPEMDKKDLDFILKKAKEHGFDTSKLIWVKQKTGE